MLQHSTQTTQAIPSLQATQTRQLAINDRRRMIALGDLLVIMVSIMLSLALWTVTSSTHFTVDYVQDNLFWFPLLSLSWLFLAYANGFYNLNSVRTRLKTLQNLTITTIHFLVVYVGIFFFAPRTALPRLLVLYYATISFLLIALWRIYCLQLLHITTQVRRVAIVGCGKASKTITHAILNHADDSYEIVGYIQDSDAIDPSQLGYRKIDARMVGALNISEIVLASESPLSDVLLGQLMSAYERGVAILPMPLLYEQLTHSVPVDHINAHWQIILPSRIESLFDVYRPFKRLLDVILALVGGMIFLAMFPIIALAIRLDTRGDIFYSQMRVGRNGKLFRIYKFRSMVKDAESAVGAVFAQKNDMRVTRVGKFLRKTRLDELPQIYNVLVGDMSIIGPRPERPEHIERLMKTIPFYNTRQVVRPGLTGWAQVCYPYGSNDEDARRKLEYDLYYVRHANPLLDCSIIWRTIGKVLSMSGQ